MNRREMFDRMKVLGAGMLVSQFPGTSRAALSERERMLSQIESTLNTTEKVRRLESLQYVVVTPEGPRDGGHFGKHTPGTRTSGLQEAVDYARANSRDVYVVGGGMLPYNHKAGEPHITRAGYHLEETLRIPWMQAFRFDGGEYHLTYSKPTGAAITIDSQMNCRYKFGPIVSLHSDGPLVHLKPETVGPDGFKVIIVSTFEFNVLQGAGGAWPGKGVRGKGTGLLLDSTSGAILHNSFFAIETVGCHKGVYLKGHDVTDNEIQVLFNHINNIHLQVGDPGSRRVMRNRITMDLIDSEKIPGSVGVDIHGQRNLLTVNVIEAAEGKALIFEPEAKENLVFAIDLYNGITNKAETPTNRIIPMWSVGFNIPTPNFPASGEDAVNREPYPVEIMVLRPGVVSDWTITDANGNAQTVSAGLSTGQTFMLEPGDRIGFTYSTTPSWRWRALA